MIKVESYKSFTQKLTIQPCEENIFTLLNEHLEAQAEGKWSLFVDEIHDWIDEKLRSHVPFKRIDSFSFRVYRCNCGMVGLTVTWHLTPTEENYMWEKTV